MQLVSLRNPREEARFAAALVRRLCRTRGMRYNDIALLCQDIDKYAICLQEAFREADVPLFLSVSRAASRHAPAEFLLSALRMLTYNFRTEDVIAHLNTGYTALTEDEANRFANYCTQWGVRGKAYLTPLTRGLPAEQEVMEPLRRKVAEPLANLKENLKNAADLKEQLAALFQFLTDTDAYARSVQRQKDLIDHDMRQLANELGQVWNRMLGAMDQMAALMDGGRIAVRDLEQMLTEALDAASIKPLPQAEDAVYAQGMDRMLDHPARAVLMLGITDRTVQGDDGLLSDAQCRELEEATESYLGADADDKACMRRFYAKTAIGMANEYLCVSYPISGADDSAQRPGAMVDSMRAIFPAMTQRGGMVGEDSIRRLLNSVSRDAINRLSGQLAEGTGGRKLAAVLEKAESGSMAALRRALDRKSVAENIRPDTAERLYGEIRRISVTRLESFAQCPFSFFAKYGLQPVKTDPYALKPADEGEFLHDAIRDFMEQCGGDIRTVDPLEADRVMDRVADRLLDIMERGPLGDTAVSLAERRRLKSVARSSAEALVRHMRGSEFFPAALEVSFGAGDGAQVQLPNSGCTLEGRIDRVDAWDGGYLRIIDYKRGGKKLNLWEVYCGYRLQLMVYLAVAMRQRKNDSAGAYYFTLDEGIISTQSTDSAAIEKERAKRFKLNGLVPDDMDVMKAMSPDYPDVFATQFQKSGQPYANAVAASQPDFARLTEHALDMADRHVADIRHGVCAATPAQLTGGTPCAYCDWHRACMFDADINAQDVQRPMQLKPADVLQRLIDEATGG